MVVACIALLVALGGTSIAAVNALPRNSVGPAQIKANAVTNPKIANSAVTNAKLAKNAVTSSKVADRSLTANDFAEGQIPAGPTGPAGPQGQAGASGWQLTTATSSAAAPATETLSVAVPCPTGKKALGGGAEILGAGKRYVAFNDNHPQDAGVGWYAEAAEVVDTPQSWQVKAFVICATVTT
jgi:hypothetical protein